MRNPRLLLVRLPLITAMLFMAVAFSPRVSGHDEGIFGESHYYDGCNTVGANYTRYDGAVHRPYDWPTHMGSYKSVLGVVNYGSPLKPCTSDGGSLTGTSSIVAVTGQGNGAGNLVQMGLAAVSDTSNGFTAQWPDFWWTPNNDGGAYAFPVDFNGDNTRETADYPVLGHTYSFHVDFISGDKFNYCVSDLSAGGTYCKTTVHSSTTPYWNLAWWGYELYNSADQVGYQSGAAASSISLMQYKNSNGSAYTTVTDDPNRPNCLDDGNAIIDVYGWHCTVGGGTGTTTIYAYTVLHV